MNILYIFHMNNKKLDQGIGRCSQCGSLLLRYEQTGEFYFYRCETCSSEFYWYKDVNLFDKEIKNNPINT